MATVVLESVKCIPRFVHARFMYKTDVRVLKVWGVFLPLDPSYDMFGIRARN